MLLLAAAAIAASSPAPTLQRTTGATASATATIRIISGVSIRWTALDSTALPRLRVSRLRASAEPQPLRLIEFE